MMKINPINIHNCKPIQFGQLFIYDDEFGVEIPINEDNYFEDNPQSQAMRDALRANIYQHQGIINDPQSIKYARDITEAGIKNFQKLSNNSYRGAALISNRDNFDLIEKTGVKTIIDLAGFKTIEQECIKRNLNYVKIDTNNGFWTNPIFKTDKELIKDGIEHNPNIKFISDIDNYMTQVDQERRKFVKKYIELVELVNHGNYYIGCEEGLYRTSNVLALISTLNPNWSGPIVEPAEDYVMDAIKKMYKNLTAEEKEALGYTADFETKLENKFA